MQDCTFCKIVRGEIPSKKKYEEKDIVVFEDLKPSAPIHYLIVPKKHSKDIGEIEDSEWIRIKEIALMIAKDNSLTGFRLVNNAGDAAGILHMHSHFLGEVSKDRAV